MRVAEELGMTFVPGDDLCRHEGPEPFHDLQRGPRKSQ
jgi:hypothetical protein